VRAAWNDIEGIKKKNVGIYAAWACGCAKEKGETMNRKMTVKALCDKVEMTRQNYYKERSVRQRREVDERHVEELVKRERCVQPRLGGRKLFYILAPELAREGIKLGRDKFFSVLRERGLPPERLPAFTPKTANSRHSLPVFRNLVKGMALTAPNQAWASDITYIRTDEGFLYLALISDMWSRKIVGYHAGDTLEAEGALAALRMAVAEMPADAKPVHHSDRGCQYCCHAYVEELEKHGMGVSMTEEAHCYENALAERVNGILQQEYFLGLEFKTKAQAKKAIDAAVYLFNTKRPHLALKYKTTQTAHSMQEAA
jgi:transposase InsO family protein